MNLSEAEIRRVNYNLSWLRVYFSNVERGVKEMSDGTTNIDAHRIRLLAANFEAAIFTLSFTIKELSGDSFYVR